MCGSSGAFTHIPCPQCFEEAIKGKESCSQCPAMNNQLQLSTFIQPKIHLSMSPKELDKLLSSYMMTVTAKSSDRGK